MIVVLLGIIKAGAAYLAVDPTYPQDRVLHVLSDSRSDFLIIDKMRPELFGNYEGRIINVHRQGDEIGREPADNPPAVNQPADVLYINYTSGSTGTPNGAMLSHDCLTNLINWQNENTLIDGSLSCLQFTSINFCVSFQEIMGTLTPGGQLHLIGDLERQDIDYLMDFLSRHQIELLFLPFSYLNFLFNESGRWHRSFAHNLKHITTAGEQLKVTAGLKRFLDLNPGLKLHNHYGSTEMHVVTSYTLDASTAGKTPIPPAGKPISNISIYILDEHLGPVPVGVWGELFVKGSSEVLGYIDNDDLTGEKLVYHPGFSRDNNRLYRSGDIGRWHPDGNIELRGRKDFMVKVRGFRIEPGEIESKILSIDRVRECVVVVKENNKGEKTLFAYVSVDNISEPEIKRIIGNDLPQYMVPQVIILDSLPLMPNGKVDRERLPGPRLDMEQEYTPPRDELEKNLAGIWSEILNIGRIGIDDNFFELGGHSLKATTVVSRVHKIFDLKVPLADFFKQPTVRELAEFIKREAEIGEKETFVSIKAVEKREYYGLSSAQKRLYILQQMDDGGEETKAKGTGYNMPEVVKLEGVIDRDRFEEIFKKVIRRHQSLRTSFLPAAEEPVQRIHDDVEFGVEYLNLAAKNAKERQKINIIRDFIRPFDLSRAPLLRVGLIKVEKEEHILMVDMHHIVSDGTSTGVLTKEFMALYAGKEFAPLRIQYNDFSQWQNSAEIRETVKKQEEYWLEEFAGEIPVLDLPLDYPRPVIQGFAGARFGIEMGEGATTALRALALKEGATLFMLLLALYNVLLSKLGGQEDIIVGTPIAGRRHADLQQVMGMFVNTLALRNHPAGEKPFNTFLKEVKQRTLAAFENQEYQFEDLVEKVAVNRDAGRNPLFDVMFALQNLERVEVEIPGLKSKPYAFETKISKFDITFQVYELDRRLLVVTEYSTALFREETLRGFLDRLSILIESVCRSPGTRISEIDILTEAEKHQLVYDFNDTGTPYPRDKTIHELFAEQAERTPDRVSVVGSRQSAVGKKERSGDPVQLTYKELNEKSDQLAHVLRDKGVGPDSIVGFMVERSIEMIMGILGILKAGGAYLPIERGYPRERVDYMLADSGAKILVSELSEESKVSGGIEVVKPGELSKESLTHPTQLCYVIYTSGTTGKPKGVLTTHYNVTRVVRNSNYIDIKPGDRFLQLSNYAFDGSVFDIYGALLNGSALVLVEKDDVLAVERLAELIKREAITVFFLTTALFNTLVDLDIACLQGIRKVLFGGERVSIEHSGSALEFLGKDRVIHVYGPTETTVYATYYFIDGIPGTAGTIPIGKPISNTTVYVLDKHLKLVPIGVSGEIYIGGTGTARGYLNNPELTAEKFLPGIYRSYKSYRTYFSKKLYRTGDLCRWLADGNIEFIGRIDRQVKIRGFRIELGEIENRLLGHDEIKDVVVVSKEDSRGTHRYLCAYFVSDGELSMTRLREYLSGSLPDYMIPSYFVPLDTIPLTPNGKVDRRALPGPESAAGREYSAPRDELEKQLISIWSDVLNVGRMGIDDDFFELGGHSLKAALLISRIHKVLHVKVPLAEFFRNPRIREFAGRIRGTAGEQFIAIKSVEKKEYYPVSSAQKRLYILQQAELESISYNMPAVMWLEGVLEEAKLEKAFVGLIERHESLRTSFSIREGDPVQRVHEGAAHPAHKGVEFEIEHFSPGHRGGRKELSPQYNEIIRDFIRPFDLSRPPLLRAGLVKAGEQEHLLVVDMHHIITDGTSVGIVVREFTALYAGAVEALSPLPVQYKDFSGWKNSELERASMRKQEAYWLKEFDGEIPPLDLITDYPRGEVKNFAGRTARFELSVENSRALKELAKEEDVTIYMVLLAIYNVLLSRLSTQEDIIVGTPVAGRSHADLQPLIGMFVNTLALRNYPGGEKTFREFLGEIKKRTLEAFENQDYPFEHLAEHAAGDRDPGRNPLFDTMFSLQNLDFPGLEIPGLQLKPYKFETRTSKFDLCLTGIEAGEKLKFIFEYRTALFKHETIDEFISYFKDIAAVVVEHRDIKLKDIDLSVNLTASRSDSDIYQEFYEDFDF
jgi:amino acid adenylation domain-containing protein